MDWVQARLPSVEGRDIGQKLSIIDKRCGMVWLWIEGLRDEVLLRWALLYSHRAIFH